ncbi:hypothetical protein Tco_0750717 [Tanacetum coccineum]|uniref:Uncharacterized protein n=1 Tax=Tanacetum coccineum TaxID=301880 RepID=A0ABQ4Z3H5_9ASTR
MCTIVRGYKPVAPPSPDYIPGPEDPQAPLVPQDEDEREPMFVQAHDPDYIPEPIYPEYIPLEDEHVFPAEEQPLHPVDSPIALSPGYVADSDPEEDPEEDSKEEHANYLAYGGDDDDDDDTNDEDEEPFEEEEEHLAPADPFDVPIVDPVPSAGDTEELEADEPAPTPPLPPAYHTTARISIRPEAPILLPPEEEFKRLIALLTPPPSPPTVEECLARCLAAPALPSSPLPRLPHPYGSPNHVRAPLGFKVTMDLLFIPPVDRREDILEAELPPHKRLCLTTPASRYEVGESSTAVPRPTGGRRVDYGFVGTLDAKARRQRAETVGYGIRDTWVDPREATKEIAPVTLEGVNTRVTELTAVQEQDTQEIYVVIEDTQDRQTQIYQTVEALVDDRQYHYETARLLDQGALVSREA